MHECIVFTPSSRSIAACMICRHLFISTLPHHQYLTKRQCLHLQLLQCCPTHHDGENSCRPPPVLDFLSAWAHDCGWSIKTPIAIVRPYNVPGLTMLIPSTLYNIYANIMRYINLFHFPISISALTIFPVDSLRNPSHRSASVTSPAKGHGRPFFTEVSSAAP